MSQGTYDHVRTRHSSNVHNNVELGPSKLPVVKEGKGARVFRTHLAGRLVACFVGLERYLTQSCRTSYQIK